MRRRIIALALMFVCVFGLIWGGESSVALAKTHTEAPVETFFGDVVMLKQEDDRYVMQVTVENRGEDFTGTVQVIFGECYDNCAYRTEITLPAQGKKQFTITVPERAMDTVYGLCRLDFLDEKGESVQAIQMKDILGGTTSGIPVGILSDNYSGLTFMDAGGDTFNMKGMEKPLDLVELDNDNLTGYLDGLYFLIIDQFNVSSLSEENIQAIQNWVNNGGWLIIGTGAYAEQTLSGFDEDFLDVEVVNVSEPGEENFASVNAVQFGYYDRYRYEDINFTQMAMAELNYNTMYKYGAVSESGDNPAVCLCPGHGAVMLLFFSLGEKELQKMTTYTVQEIYREPMYNSSSYHSMRGGSNMESLGRSALSFMDNINANVDFSGLRALILIYVILVGPVLYLILRKCKKREWYWVGAPALGILFIAGVFFFGRSTRVNETKAYSVTVQQVDGSQEDTYLLAYHSGVKPWTLHLQDSYEVAGPGFLGYNNYYYVTSGIDDYHYLVSDGSQGLSVGLKPQENFESAFLYAGGRTESKGALTVRDLTEHGFGNVSGVITNETGYDLAYMAVWFNSYITVISDVKAGETVDIQQAVIDGRGVYQESVPYFDDLLHSMVGVYLSRSRDYEQDDMAALFIGLGIAEKKKPQSGGSAIIAGVVKDYDKVFTDKCSEISYGCLYSYAQFKSGAAGDTTQSGSGAGSGTAYPSW